MAIADVLDWGLFRPRNLIPAILAMVVGVVAWFGIRPILSDAPESPQVVEASVPATVAAPPPPEPEAVYPEVLVARRGLRAGVVVVNELVEWVEWRDEIDLDAAVVQGAVPIRAVLGSVTVRPFREGEPLAWDGLVVPGSPGFITAVLEAGRRAVTIEVDRATTDAKIIFPGDRVDVILVANAGATGPAAGPAAQSVVRDARVLAVGSTIVSLGRYGRASLSSGGIVEAVTAPQGETYTLEVTPKDAARISLAANTGQLTLAIRPILETPAGGGYGGPVRLDEIVRSPELEAPPRVQVIRGGGDNAAREAVVTTLARKGA